MIFLRISKLQELTRKSPFEKCQELLHSSKGERSASNK